MQTLPAIAKAIRESALQLNPRVEGQEVLVPVPRWRPLVGLGGFAAVPFTWV